MLFFISHPPLIERDFGSFFYFEGIGYATAVIVFLLNCEYNVILSWAFYYIFASFTSVLPWSHCDNEWNTENCTTHEQRRLLLQNATSTEAPSSPDDTSSASASGSTAGVVTSTLAYDTNALNGTVALDFFRNDGVNASAVIYPDPVTEFWE